MALSVSIDLLSSSARVTSVKFQKHHVLTEGHPDPKIGPQVYLGPIKIKMSWCKKFTNLLRHVLTERARCRSSPEHHDSVHFLSREEIHEVSRTSFSYLTLHTPATMDKKLVHIEKKQNYPYCRDWSISYFVPRAPESRSMGTKFPIWLVIF